MSRLRIFAFGVALATLATLALPGLAGAQTGLQTLKAACDTAIASRLSRLATLKTNLAAATTLAGSDRASLDNEIDATVSGLTTLKGTIDADTTLLIARADCRMIVTSYYVYVFLVPKAQLIRAADRVEAAAGVLKNLQHVLQGIVTAKQAQGRNVASAQGYVTDLGVKVAAASQAASGIVAQVLPLVASGFPGNRTILLTARTSLGTARDDLQGATEDATNAINALKAL